MGLGKTIQIISLIYALFKDCEKRKKVFRVLIISPSTVVNNWYDEFNKWLTGGILTFTI